MKQSHSLSVWKRLWEAIFMPITQRLRTAHGSDDRSSRTRETISHVAAVCYRIRDGEIEFLLVRTRAGRWTFPKGRVEDDATRSAAAAREAFEEAGVHGRVDSLPFATYMHSKTRGIRA